MPLYEPLIPVRYALPLLAFVREMDSHLIPPMLAAAGVASETLDDPAASLTIVQFELLLRGAGERLGRTDIAFELGERISLNDHNSLSQLLRACTTLDQLLRVAERYYRLVFPVFAANYRWGPKYCEWRMGVVAPVGSDALHGFFEIHAVSTCRDLLRLVGPKAQADIYLSMPPPPHRARYQSLGLTRFHFDSGHLPEFRCRFPTSLMNVPIGHQASTGSAAVVTALNQQMATVLLSERYGAWATTLLQEVVGVQPTLDGLAELLCISRRTLERKLAQEGVNFRELSTRIRHERACEYLTRSKKNLGQIASELGYADVTGFIRAFRIRCGQTPDQYRQASCR